MAIDVRRRVSTEILEQSTEILEQSTGILERSTEIGVCWYQATLGEQVLYGVNGGFNNVASRELSMTPHSGYSILRYRPTRFLGAVGGTEMGRYRLRTILLRICYAMPGTDMGYAATRQVGLQFDVCFIARNANLGTRLRACYAMPGTDSAYGCIGLRDCYVMPGTDMANGSIGLRTCCAMSGTNLANGSIGLWACYAIPGTDLAYATTRTSRSQRRRCPLPGLSPRCLRCCYAKSGTDIVYDAIGLRAWYALPGTDIACGTTCLRMLCDVTDLVCHAISLPSTDVACGFIFLRACYARSHTDLRACYAVSGTDLAYGATRSYRSCDLTLHGPPLA
eukprot:867780-Rhodomonas_salina.2